MISSRFAFFLIVPAILIGEASPGLADSVGPYTAQLVAESDALLRCAIHRPYGLAWDREAAGELAIRPTPHAVAMGSLGTPAAGLILLWTGQLLHEPRYIQAADDAARAVAASLLQTGRIPAHPMFGPMPGGREEPAVIADRSATNAGLGLLLAMLDVAQFTNQSTTQPMTEPADLHAELMHRSAARAARWLVKQQAPNGLWPSVFPADGSPKDAVRLIRLDNADYRDSTFALLLSFDLLHDDMLHHFASRPLEGLLKLRLVRDVHGPNLWCTACTVDATDVPAGFPNGPDLLASRCALQTLLGTYLLTGDPNLVTAMDQAATSLSQMKNSDGVYDRFLDPTSAADMARLLGKIEPASRPFFEAPASQPAVNHSIVSHSMLADPSLSGSFGIPELLETFTRLKSVGRDQYLDLLKMQVTVHQNIEACMCGLMEDPFDADFPQKAADAPAYVSAHAAEFKLAAGPAPDDLAGRIRRLRVLFLLTKIEWLPNSTP